MMGVYIPNKAKPKKCGQCPCAYFTEGALSNVCQITGDDIDDIGELLKNCPIEEEPTGILAHDIRKVATFVKSYMIVAQTYDEQVERAKAVKDWLMGIVGERRNDE